MRAAQWWECCRYSEDMELEDAIHTALLTLKEGFEGQIAADNIGPPSPPPPPTTHTHTLTHTHTHTHTQPVCGVSCCLAQQEELISSPTVCHASRSTVSCTAVGQPTMTPCI